MKRLTLILLFLVCQNKPAGTFCRDRKINYSASEEDSIEEQFSLGKGFVGLWEVFGFLEKRVFIPTLLHCGFDSVLKLKNVKVWSILSS